MEGKQTTLAESGFERHRKATRRDVFLIEMERVVPWSSLCSLVEPHYPKAPEGAGRPPVGLERMLRIYFLQQWYNLSDPTVEEALHDSAAMRRFVGIDLGREPVHGPQTIVTAAAGVVRPKSAEVAKKLSIKTHSSISSMNIAVWARKTSINQTFLRKELTSLNESYRAGDPQSAHHHLLQGNTELSEAAQSLSRQFGLSRRQAYRYLEEAAKLKQPVSSVEVTVPITLKLPLSTVRLLRAQAKASGQTMGQIVTLALAGLLETPGRHG